MPFRPFFLPSSEITNQLLTSMSQRRARVLREASRNYESEGEEPESEELMDSLLVALEEEPESSPEQDWQDQRWLSDMVYHLLGMLAGRARRQSVSVHATPTSMLVQGMSTNLGLYESQDMPLLKELAAEFSSWLSKQPNNSYPAGWGRIVLDPYRSNLFYLEPFDRNASATPTEVEMEMEMEVEEWEMPVAAGGRAVAANAGARMAETDFETEDVQQ
jgi:hypothetical protein